MKNPNYLPSAKKAYDLLQTVWIELYNERSYQGSKGSLKIEEDLYKICMRINDDCCSLHKYLENIKEEEEE